VENLVSDYGLYVLFAVIAIQAAGGAGLPGKTTLVVASILAADGQFAMWHVLAVAAVAGIAGGYVGYALGRFGGRRIVEWPPLACRIERPLGMTERFFAAHGSKAVFFARFLPGFKVLACPAAGLARMKATAFLFWHALGAIGFALVFGLTAYWAGEAAIELVERYGLYALLPLGLAFLVVYAVVRRRGWSLKNAGAEGARG
jgi:membrane protein DedA with SNARE-associated domain